MKLCYLFQVNVLLMCWLNWENISYVSLIYIFIYSLSTFICFFSQWFLYYQKNYFYVTGEITSDKTAPSPWKLSYFITTWEFKK